ncbi:Fe2+-dependent dioxygenase [Aestuariibacter sp. A3R04]|uniref:Fe2+-dependent dioxygenase n=1 Tax=Aestuariibacter sp. A3R04 TaxID=2841571 RepID=UPI001C0849C5|nr:Fe2+-dependent dioxygenase [Aestuariibacter sp. A3R04]MBU3023954.1 Fe2+-dependent dioxygenase [Aestuariibacter sp. A3R04]
MLVRIENFLTKQEVSNAVELLEQSDWIDGATTAGHLALHAKKNLQLPENSPSARKLGDFILSLIGQSQQILAAGLPNKIYPPMFNCYQENGEFGSHIDNTIRRVSGTAVKVRTDISMTVFFSEPEEYEGGELIIQDTYGEQRIKFAAGDIVMYPSTSLHRVSPVTKGRRLASFFWMQSLVRSAEQRRILYDLDLSIQTLTAENPHNPEIVRLSGVYHNLLRQWSET